MSAVLCDILSPCQRKFLYWTPRFVYGMNKCCNYGFYMNTTEYNSIVIFLYSNILCNNKTL